MNDSMRSKYNQHKNSAKQRGIDFDLTFDEWCEIWDGKFHLRGTGANQLGMLRTRDEGGYTKGNVRLGTPRENQQEKAVGTRVRRSQIPTTINLCAPLVASSWLGSRNRVFQEYVEEDE